MPPKASVKGKQLDMDSVSTEFSQSSDINIFVDRFLEHPDFPKFVCDLLYPVNKGRYIQFPNDDGSWDVEEDPNIKFPDTLWETVFDETGEGTFFKTEGHEPTQMYDSGNLVPYRVNGLSKDKSQRMFGRLQAHYLVFDDWHIRDGVFSAPWDSSLSQANSGGNSARRGIIFDSMYSSSARTTTDTAGRTEPQNRLMRIWLRKG